MKLHRKIANYFGYELVNLSKNNLTLETHLMKLFKLLQVNVILDVGANCGQYAHYLRKIGYTGYILSFEPVSACYSILVRAADSDSKWRTYPIALGDCTEQKSINITESSVFSSFLNPNSFSCEHFSTESRIASSETVQVKRLDSILYDLLDGLEAPRIFLKTDTQGYDIEVIKGASQVIHLIAGIQSEVSMLPIYNGMPDFITALNIYRNAGFDITGLYPVSRAKNSLKIIEYDCVMSRT